MSDIPSLSDSSLTVKVWEIVLLHRRPHPALLQQTLHGENRSATLPPKGAVKTQYAYVKGGDRVTERALQRLKQYNQRLLEHTEDEVSTRNSSRLLQCPGLHKGFLEGKAAQSNNKTPNTPSAPDWKGKSSDGTLKVLFQP